MVNAQIKCVPPVRVSSTKLYQGEKFSHYYIIMKGGQDHLKSRCNFYSKLGYCEEEPCPLCGDEKCNLMIIAAKCSILLFLKSSMLKFSLFSEH